jgi:hypothetical protein
MVAEGRRRHPLPPLAFRGGLESNRAGGRRPRLPRSHLAAEWGARTIAGTEVAALIAELRE